MHNFAIWWPRLFHRKRKAWCKDIFLLLLKEHRTTTTPISFCWKWNEGRLNVCQWSSFYLSLYVAYVSCCVIAHCCCVCCFYGYFFVVWKRFVAVDVLWAFKCFGTYSSGVIFLHIEVLAISGSCSHIIIISNTNFVLFCWVWCFIAWVLWVHLCDFSAIAMFLFMAISMAFMFSLHYSYS